MSLLIFFFLKFVPVAQLDRASDYESEGWEFDSLRARQKKKHNLLTFFLLSLLYIVLREELKCQQ